MENVLIVNSSGRLGGAEKILINFFEKSNKDIFRFFALVPSPGKFFDVLKEKGIDISIAGNLYKKKFVTRDDSVLRRPFSTANSVMALLKFSKDIFVHVRVNQIDLVVSCGVKSSIASGLAAKFGKSRCTWLIQDILPDNLYFKIFKLCARIFPDRIITISRAIKSSFPKSVQAKTDIFIPFLKKDELDTAKRSRSLRKELNIKDKDLVLGIIGKLVPFKGIDIFLNVISVLKKTNPRIKALIVGDAELEVANPIYENELKKLSRDLGLREDVIFTGWREDIYDILATIDILVHPPKRPEGFGRVLIEAMAASKPIVAFDHGAVREIIEDGISGILVEPLDEALLAAKLNDLIYDEAKRNRMGEAARKKVEEHFNEREHDLFSYL